jgi:hypothetical protein
MTEPVEAPWLPPERAIPFAVPLTADPVLGQRLLYGSHATDDVKPGMRPNDAILFPMSSGRLGRVTFEGLDAIKASRGECLPYERATADGLPDEWVYLVVPSGWLTERDRYEREFYDTPLTLDYDHYLFSFHDEFIEAIAQGVWFDHVTTPNVHAVPLDHPLLELSPLAIALSATAEGIAWELRVNPKPMAELVDASRFCSQRLFQYNLVLDDGSREHRSVWLRTRNGRCRSTFAGPWVGASATHDGVATAETFADDWYSAVSAVARRRTDGGC